MRTIALIIIGIGTYAIMGCSDNEVSKPGPKFPSVALTDVPLSSGTEWVYLVDTEESFLRTDTTTYERDTVTVAIGDQFELPEGQMATRWTLRSSSHVDTSWFKVRSDTLIVLIPGTLDSIPVYFPLEADQSWEAGAIHLSTYIVSIDGELQDLVGLWEDHLGQSPRLTRTYDIERGSGVTFMVQVEAWPDSLRSKLALLLSLREGPK
jgi:hypothetical protein